VKKIWKEQYAVNWDDISLDGKLSLTGLNIMLQRAATYHAEHLGFGFTQTSVYNASWVLFRINLELIRMPEWCDQVVVETWPRVVKGLAAYRDFIVTTPEGEVLCRATSEWFIIDLTSRRPQQIEKYVDVELYTMPTAGSPTDLSAEGMEVGKPTDKCICAYLSFCFRSLFYIRKLSNRELK